VALNATDVVLWPQKSLTQTGYNENTGYITNPTGTQVKGVANLTAHEDDNVNALLTASENPVYSVIPLTGDNGLNWGTSTGYILGENGKFGLDKKFQMADQSSFGKLNISGGNVSWVSNPNLMFAPVGSNGVETIIPKGCVAFKVESGGSQTVRIIVAVPTSEFHLNEAGFDLDMTNDYYIGLWKMPDIDKNANGDQYINFEKSDALEKFELPRSYSYSFDHSPTSIETGMHYVNVVYNGQAYRTYLNGDTFLVAYEFTVQGNGVYVIGSVHGADDKPSNTDVPMEIVHFSVSGTASAGRDGVNGNLLGAIDFVYDDLSNNIVTIDTTTTSTNLPNATTNATEYYGNYYASQSMLFTDYEEWVEQNVRVTFNQVRVALQRKVRETSADSDVYETVISYTVVSQNTHQRQHILVKPYTINADVIVKTEEQPTS
jgi:hypothetical protein